MRNRLISRAQLVVVFLLFGLSVLFLLKSFLFVHTQSVAEHPYVSGSVMWKGVLKHFYPFLHSTAFIAMHVVVVICLFYLSFVQIVAVSLHKIRAPFHRVVGSIICFLLGPIYIILTAIIIILDFSRLSYSLYFYLILLFSATCLYIGYYFARKKQWQLHVSFMVMFYTFIGAAAIYLFYVLIFYGLFSFIAINGSWVEFSLRYKNYFDLLTITTIVLILCLILGLKKSQFIEYSVPVCFVICYVLGLILARPYFPALG
jgi:hypothetical protein